MSHHTTAATFEYKGIEMSEQHPIWPLTVNAEGGKLLMTPCPGVKETGVEESLKQLQQSGAQAVLTLMSNSELDKNGVADLGDRCQAAGLKWYHCPVPDDRAPESEFVDAWANASGEVHSLLNQGAGIAIHCKGGSGRTGLIAAQILLERGWPLDKVRTEVNALRPKALSLPMHVEYISKGFTRVSTA
jgi:protein-tyrosine phosphatase